MAIHTTDAIILKEQDLRETSLLVTFYTRDFGKIKGLIKGVRGPRGPLGFQVQVFTLNKIVFYESKKSDIHIASQCDLIDFFEDIRRDIGKTSYAYYFIELIDALTEGNEKNKEVFDLLLTSLNFLKKDVSSKRIARIFEIKLLAFSGVMPRLDKCSACGVELDVMAPQGGMQGSLSKKGAEFSYKFGGVICSLCRTKDAASRRIMPGTINFIEHVERASLDKLERLKVSKEVGEELEEIMSKFLAYHVSTRLKTLEFIRSIEH